MEVFIALESIIRQTRVGHFWSSLTMKLSRLSPRRSLPSVSTSRSRSPTMRMNSA